MTSRRGALVALNPSGVNINLTLGSPDLFGLIEATSNAGGCVAASATLTGTVVATSPTAQTSDMPLSETLIAARLIIP